MKKQAKKTMLQEGGKYCLYDIWDNLDVSKLVFGGVILAGIMKQNIEDYMTLFIIGGLVFALLIVAGFLMIDISNKLKGK